MGTWWELKLLKIRFAHQGPDGIEGLDEGRPKGSRGSWSQGEAWAIFCWCSEAKIQPIFRDILPGILGVLAVQKFRIWEPLTPWESSCRQKVVVPWNWAPPKQYRFVLSFYMQYLYNLFDLFRFDLIHKSSDGAPHSAQSGGPHSCRGGDGVKIKLHQQNCCFWKINAMDECSQLPLDWMTDLDLWEPHLSWIKPLQAFHIWNVSVLLPRFRNDISYSSNSCKLINTSFCLHLFAWHFCKEWNITSRSTNQCQFDNQQVPFVQPAEGLKNEALPAICDWLSVRRSSPVITGHHWIALGWLPVDPVRQWCVRSIHRLVGGVIIHIIRVTFQHGKMSKLKGHICLWVTHHQPP